jgi:hypothetical protein
MASYGQNRMDEETLAPALEYTHDVQRDLQRAVFELQAKQGHIAYFMDAYEGKGEVPHLSDRLKSIFKGLKVQDIWMNVCGTVIDACADKITLQGFTVKSAQETIDKIVAQTELLLEADDAHRHGLITGAAYLIAWRDDDAAAQISAADAANPIDCYFHEAHQCHLFYDKNKPNEATYGVKWWCGDDYEIGAGGEGTEVSSTIYFKLYYPDVLLCFKTKDKVAGIQSVKFDALIPADDEEHEVLNPYGIVPVFELKPDRRKMRSDLQNVIPLQIVTNINLINETVSGEFNAFKQKYIISNASNISQLKSSPSIILDIPAAQEGEQPTSVGEFDASDLSNYTNAIASKIEAIAAVSRTPIHYFFRSGSVPSGEALIALEAPLNKKAQDRIDRFTVVWKRIASFLLLLSGVQVAPEDITPRFAKPETIQPVTRATIIKTLHDAEMPLAANLRMNGIEESEIETIQKEAQAEKEEAISNAMNAFNAGVDSDGNPMRPNRQPPQQQSSNRNAD